MAKFLDSAGLAYLWGKIQQSINEQIAANVRLEVVQDLPASGEGNIIYLVPGQTTATSNIYDEYIWTGTPGDWEKIGTTATDLADYYTKNQIDSKLGTLASGYNDFASWISTINTSLGNLSTIVGNGSGISGADLTASIVALESLVGQSTDFVVPSDFQGYDIETIGVAVTQLLESVGPWSTSMKGSIGDAVDNATVAIGCDDDGPDADGSIYARIAQNAADIATNASDISTLNDVVGDSNAGLAKDVEDLQTAVGDAEGGLVKAVADNASAISSLETTIGDPSDTSSDSTVYGAINSVDEKIGNPSDTTSNDTVYGAIAGKANAGDIPTVNDSTITIKQNGETKGTFTLNQSTGSTIDIGFTGSTIDVGFGRETVFTAEFLKKVLTCRMNNEVYLTSLFDPSPNMVKYNGLSDPGTSSTNWCGYGVACTAGESTRIIIHNVNVDPWKGRTFTFTIAAGYEFAIASGTVTQSPSWLRTYPQTSDLPWNWHGHNDPVTITIGDMLSIMIKAADGSVIGWSSFYVTMWDLLTIEETPDSVQNPPRQLKDNRYVGYRVGVLGDSILAGASTRAYKTALDVLVSDYGIIPVPRCIAGSCIAPTSADYPRDNIYVFYGCRRYKDRIEANWRVTTGGYNGQEGGVNRETDPFLGVLIFGVNDVLMDKVALDAEPFIETTDETTGCIEKSINTAALNPEGYVAALLDLESTIKTANGAILNQFYLVGPYNCKWPGDYPMTTTGKNPNGDTGEDYIRVQRQFCMLKGWGYMDLLSSQLNTTHAGMSNDNLHPSQEGHQLLGDLLGQMLCKTILTQAAPIFDTVEGGGGSGSIDPEAANEIYSALERGNQTTYSDVELPLNGYIDATTHEFIESSEYKCSGLVLIKGARFVEYKTRSIGNSYHICFYDKHKNSLPTLDFPVANEGIQGTIDLSNPIYSEAYYLILSAYPGGYPPFLRLKGDYDFTEAIFKKDLDYKEGYNLFNLSGCTRGKGLHPNTGALIEDAQSIVSNLMTIPPANERGATGNLHFYNLPVTESSKRFVQLDEDMNVVRGPSDIPSEDTSIEIGIASNAKYLRFTLVWGMSTLPTESEIETMYGQTIITVHYRMTEYQPYHRNISEVDGIGLCASSVANLYKGKKWVVIGDSLTEKNTRSTKFYYDYVKEWLGFDVVNMGVSGTGYKSRDDVDNPTTNGAFYQRATLIPANTDVVTIFGSFNDLTQGFTLGTPGDTGTTTICGCMKATIEAIYTINPAMKLGIIAPCPWNGLNPSNANAVAYVEALHDICMQNSIPFLNLFYESGLRPWIREVRDLVYNLDSETDGDFHGIHPNAIGHEMIASKIKVFIQSLI